MKKEQCQITLRPNEKFIDASVLSTKGIVGAFRFSLNDVIEFPDSMDDIKPTMLLWRTHEVYNVNILKNDIPMALPLNSLRKAPIDAAVIEYPKIQKAMQDSQNFEELARVFIGKKIRVIEMRDGLFPRFENGNRLYNDAGESITSKVKYPIFEEI